MMDFSWLNESELKERKKASLSSLHRLGQISSATTALFRKKALRPESLHNAPYYYTEIEAILF